MEIDGNVAKSEGHERFTRLLIHHEPQLLRCILLVVPNRIDARDILQEASVSLWRQFSEYDPERPFVNWALGFVRMEVRRFLRKSHRRAQLTERAAELLYQEEQQRAVELDSRVKYLKHCLRGLPRNGRELLEAYYFKNHTVNTLSQNQMVSVEAVYKRLQRIRLALHKCIQSKVKEAAL